MELNDIIIMMVKIIVVTLALIHVVPIMVWVERRGSALMQNRLGPNRVGPLGLLQSLADGIKFMFKEEVIPNHVEKFYYVLAPAILLIPALLTFAVVPFGGDITIAGKTYLLQIANLDIGILYMFAIGSLGVYGIIIAGWASNNKYALLGSLRSSAQMISYELSLGLSVIGVAMIYGTFNLREIAVAQSGTLFGILPAWNIFIQPLGALIFTTAVFAETNRLPFDLPEGESEIVAGYHLEYGSMKMAMFFMAEYINMTTASALISTLFFGGYQLLPGMSLLVEPIANVLAGFSFFAGGAQGWALALLQIASFSLKVAFFLWFFVWVRWTIPRFRYDQLMDLGWKVMLPLSLLNIAITGVLIYLRVI